MAGIYIHIPFCRKACNYCNFHFSTTLHQRKRVLDAIIKEIQTTVPVFDEHQNIETIYFGGGTPSILTEEELISFLSALKRFQWTNNIEVTLEANPDDISTDKLKFWKQAGINRLSVGIQSFQEYELQWMNRSHNAQQSLLALHDIADEGFTNYSADLIYGSPLLSDAALKNNLQILIEKGIPHISCYALTVEPKTALAQQIHTSQSPEPDQDVQLRQFNVLVEALGNAGYEHYEISNFALPGMRSKHNSSYWKGVPYMGYGPSAHSYNGINTRRWNIANNMQYVKLVEEGSEAYSSETLTQDQIINERIMISLRTMEGIDLHDFEKDFGTMALTVLLTSSEPYCTRGELLMENHSLKLTSAGKFLADGITAGLFV